MERRRHSLLPLFLLLFGMCSPLRVAAAPASSEIRIGFGSCVQDPQHLIWDHLALARLDLFVLLGDTIYLASPELKSEASLAAAYAKHFSPETKLGKFLRTTPVVAIWDDHDSGPDNGDSTHPDQKRAAKVFQAQWHPSLPFVRYGGGVAGYLPFRGIDFFLTDNRTYRFNPGKRRKPSLFGSGQLRWLSSSILRSVSPLRIIASGGQLTGGRHADEPISDFPEDQQALHRLLGEGGRAPVLVISGDRHFGSIRKSVIGSKTVIEATSSPLAAPLAPEETIRNELDEGAGVRVFRGVNYGLISTKDDLRQARVQILDQSGVEQIGETIELGRDSKEK